MVHWASRVFLVGGCRGRRSDRRDHRTWCYPAFRRVLAMPRRSYTAGSHTAAPVCTPETLLPPLVVLPPAYQRTSFCYRRSEAGFAGVAIPTTRPGFSVLVLWMKYCLRLSVLLMCSLAYHSFCPVSYISCHISFTRRTNRAMSLTALFVRRLRLR